MMRAMMRYLAYFAFLLPSLSFPATFSMQLHQVQVSDVARIVYGDVLHQSFILDAEVIQSGDIVSLNWIKLNKKEVDTLMRDLLERRGFELVQRGNVLLVRNRSKEDEDLLIYQPRNRSAKYLSDVLAKVADAHQLGTRGIQSSPEFKSAISKQTEVVGSASSMVDRSAPDQMAYQCLVAKCERLHKLLVQLDTPEAQIVLRAAVYEVGTTRGEGSAVQIAGKLLQGQLTATAGSIFTGNAQLHLAGANLDAVLAVLDQDSRFHVVSRPMLRVKTGAQAKFSVGQQVPVLGAITQDKNGNSLQSVEYRQSGTIFTVQPDVRQDVVDLNITQELSNFVATTTGVNNSPTMLQRTATSQLSIKPGEVIVFAGLEEQRNDQVDSSFFGIPLGQRKNNSSSEVLVFIEAERI